MVIETFLTVGIDNLDKKYFDPIDNSVFFKPICGLWATRQKDDVINSNEWLDYLIKKDRNTYFDKYEKYEFNLPAIFLTLKENSRIYNVKSINDLLSIMESFPNKKDTWWRYDYNNSNLTFIDYEKVSTIYDGIFFDISILQEEANGDLFLEENIINPFCIDTLILFNLDCIAYYQQAEINITPFGYANFDDYDIPYIINISNEKKLVKDSRDEYDLILSRYPKYKMF